MSRSVNTTCPYCGVGCGIVATVQSDNQVVVKGDVCHPANYGRVCSKGSALGQTVDLEGRLLHPMIHGQQASWDEALSVVSKGFRKIIADNGPEAVAFYVSGQLLTEDYYVANKFMKGFIGTANIDTNSRLCMSSTVAGYKRAFGSDTMPCSYADLERAKLIVLTGSNTAWCHPVIYQRIVKAKKENPDLLVVNIDPRRTATCEVADLHLALRSGTDSILFNGLLVYLHENDEANQLFVNQFTQGAEGAFQAAVESAPSIAEVAARCALDQQDVAQFYRLFARTERVVTVFSQGINQSSSGTDKVNSIINCHLLTGRIGRPGMGPFSLTGQPNAMGGREVGGLANQLAAHMEIENDQHRRLVQQFWQSPGIAQQPGLKAVDLFNAVEEGEIKAVWIMGTNPVVSVPDADKVRMALRKCELVVVSDCMRYTDTTAMGNILLPSLAWGEKDGTVTNSERRLSRQQAFLPGPGEARPDWWIICQVAKGMGFSSAFNYESAAQIFREHAALSGYENNGERDFDISALAELDDESYDKLTPVQWPVPKNKPNGTERLFGDGRFFTPDKKARFISVHPRAATYPTDENFPFVLNTGRVRDQWHTMTRTGKAWRLSEHSPEPYADIHPDDAKQIGLQDGSLVRIFSRWGEVIVRSRINEEQPQGTVFVPIHWNDQFASKGRIDSIVNPATDPISGQPEFKHTPVRVQLYQPAWHGFLLSRRELKVTDASFWVKAKGKSVYRYELAGDQTSQHWPSWARSLLCQSDNDVNWVEYLDVAAKRYRGIRLTGNRVESCIFIAPSHELPSRSWLAGLFEKDLSPAERTNLLIGRPMSGQQDTGRIVCACFGIGEKTLLESIKTKELSSVEQIGETLKAGTNCGSCIPELRKLLDLRKTTTDVNE